MNHFGEARKQETEYHEVFYRETELFTPGTWLAKPVKTVMNLLQDFTQGEPIHVLDLGCGVGRNSIPIAQVVKPAGGSVVCVDLLPIATQKLEQYANQYEVQSVIQPVVADVEHYEIAQHAYDYIVACSCLEHVSNLAAFQAVVKRMIRGTREQGINCILINTEVVEYDMELDEQRPGVIELPLKTDETIHLLKELYRDWDIRIVRVIPQCIAEKKNGRAIEFRGNWLTFAAQQRISHSEDNQL
ncbi:bifunctional 2-polyprenyl-6-hydroxyphenol methylase/3-demethylubiquinol 3-O-methyltransferase UbiG [Paenibacillus sp. CF384]|uniref:class I SAM-dependent methyltransferase n=1 Tax=Paenibacillus sp. CF384 TaxID=1884382 RepID=UPI000897131C|nr:class I SAM-dependent methyltransferase [Paenibacillus sp. CF384]SDX63462.1 Methyltransferase domain-containing protein [Paenibacillus sp. CF384]